jgi:hypothetical protein
MHEPRGVDTDTNSGLADSAEVRLCRIWHTDKKEGKSDYSQLGIRKVNIQVLPPPAYAQRKAKRRCILTGHAFVVGHLLQPHLDLSQKGRDLVSGRTIL